MPATRTARNYRARLIAHRVARLYGSPVEKSVGDYADREEVTVEPSPLWTPLPGPQTQGCVSKADIIGYGGQAGGGKTDLGIGLPLREHYRAIIFRRFYTDLKDIVRRAKEITEGKRTGFNGSDFTLTLPGDRTLEFGAMKEPDDWERFKGRAKDCMVFDEATEFFEKQVRSVIGWVRSTRPGQRRRVILTFNPPTSAEGEWIIQFFAPWLDETHPNPAKDGELRWFAMLPDERGEMREQEVPSGDPITVDGEVVYPLSRTFIRAKLEDNPYLNNDGQYRRVLQSLPEPLRSQLLKGVFNAAASSDPWQVIPPAWVKAAFDRWKAANGPEVDPTVLGVDVSRGGDDQMVLAKRHGDWIAPLEKHPGKAVPDGNVAAAVIINANVPPALVVNIDVVGIGASAYDLTKDQIGGVTPINFGAKSTAKDKSGKLGFANLRAEAYWMLREELDPAGDPTLMLPPDPELLGDLCAPRYKLVAAGIQIEKKEEIKKRLKRSTDCGDAVVLASLPITGDWQDAIIEDCDDSGISTLSAAASVNW